MYVYTLCIYVCMYVYIYISLSLYIYIYIHTNITDLAVPLPEEVLRELAARLSKEHMIY